jgi:hypothetical protein
VTVDAVSVLRIVLQFAVATVGLFVAYQAYRGYRRNRSRAMFALAVATVLLVLPQLVFDYGFEPVGLFSALESAIARQVTDIVAVLVLLYALTRA